MNTGTPAFNNSHSSNYVSLVSFSKTRNGSREAWTGNKRGKNLKSLFGETTNRIL